MPPVALCSRGGVCNPSWPSHMLWEHRLTSAILCVRQLLQHCNLILPTEMPASAAARTSSILKPSQQKNQVRDSLGCIHHGHLGFPDTTGTCNHIPAAVPLVVMTEHGVLHRLGLPSTPYVTLPSDFIVMAPIHHVCSQPSLPQASATCEWKHPLSWHSQEAKTEDACLCQGFPWWRDLALLKPFQSMLAREVSINSSFWHVPGSQPWSTILSQLRIFLAGKVHHLLLPMQSQQSQCDYCCCHGLCEYSWVLRSSNSCKTDDSGLVQGLCKPVYPSPHIWAVLPQWSWYPDVPGNVHGHLQIYSSELKLKEC